MHRPIAIMCLALPAAAAAEELPAACGRDTVAIGWTQPPQRPIDDPEAVRWPIDATFHIAYGGNACPGEDELTLRDETGAPVPAQVRVRVPYVLTPHTELPLSLLEIDPEQPLAPHTDYTLVWSPADVQLSAFERYALEVKTFGREMYPLPLDELEGILGVEPLCTDCNREGGSAGQRPGGDGPPGCLTADRIILAVRYRPVQRTDVVHVVERVSSTLLDGDGEPRPGASDDTVVPVAYDRGGDDRFDGSGPSRNTPVVVPTAPSPRRDCFRVRLLDARGEARGDPTAIACIDIGAGAGAVDRALPPPLPLRACEPLGIHGGDPHGAAATDGGLPDGGEAPGRRGDDCTIAAPGAGGAPWSPLWLALGLLARRRRPG